MVVLVEGVVLGGRRSGRIGEWWVLVFLGGGGVLGEGRKECRIVGFVFVW